MLSSELYNQNPHASKTSSLYWDGFTGKTTEKSEAYMRQ